MPYRRGKYGPLCQYLEQLPPEVISAQLTFSEIEALISDTLPPTARSPGYWSGSGVARVNWRRSGWYSRLVRGAVVFSRLPHTRASG